MAGVIGRYRTERVLGSGAFALVWLAVDDALQAQVAIKVLAENWAHDEAIRQRFADEARILWRADSPHIVRVHTVEQLPDGRPYFVMDYADRGSLDDRMRDRSAAGYSFHVEEAVAISLDIAEGLAVAHALGIVHRDLKPSNVLFQSVPAHHRSDRDERLVLADFGIARSLLESRGTTIATGTPKYMAPEQAQGRADPRSDIYAAAVILYELLAGRVPHPYDSVGLLIEHQHDPVVPLGQLRPDVPAHLSAAVARALSPDPGLRHATVEEWSAALRGELPGVTAAPPAGPPARPAIAATMGPEEFAAARPAGGPPPGPPPGAGGYGPPPGGWQPPGPFRPPDDGRRRKRAVPWVPIAAVIVLIALIAGIAVATSRRSGSKEGEVFLTPVASVGNLPEFTPDLVPHVPIIPAGLPPITLPTLPDGVTLPQVSIPTVLGGAPGLYGGTNQLSVCDAKLLVGFLTTHADKAKAWAEAQGISVADIPSFVAGLTDVVLQGDVRVTNHGFKKGKANPIAEVLERGTAVLVDRFGVPRVRCKCGNPLSPPKAANAALTFAGTAWKGFDPTKILVVVANALPIEAFTLTDLAGGPPVVRVPGIDIGGATTPDTTTTAPATTEAPTTAAPTTTTAAPVENITPTGTVGASSTFSDQFRTGLAVDGKLTTSWFSAGVKDGDTTTFTWTAPTEAVITSVKIFGNARNSDPANRKGFGFNSVTVEIVDSTGTVTFRQDVGLPGTPDPDVTVSPNARGSAVRLLLHGHESPDCGGIAELQVLGHP